ncbi:MAG: hypothetical protein KA371_07090 [Acidobacteria bacterium]|nr:hypothetical protein [Acidobacteriota bacterium]
MHGLNQLVRWLIVALATVAVTAQPVWAQEPKSAAGAKELAQLLAAKKLDAVAVRAPDSSDTFLAALVFPSQIIVVSAQYAAPPLLNEKLARSEYRDVYIELNSASVVESRFFVTDIGADGVRPKRARRDDPFDTRDAGGEAFNFDGNWREDKMSEADYMKVYAETDERYARILAALLGEAKK